ncbi:MAG: AAA family ATPase [Planctomycetota bacterium]
MYEALFGLSSRPFAAVPLVDHYYPGEAIEAARETLARSIERAEGVGMVVGPSGTGKTLLCAMLAEQFKESFQVALLSSGRLSTRRALLQAILFELGQPYRAMDEGELRLALVDHLTVGEECPNGMLLLIDEAHTLPVRLLDEVRMITNLVAGGQPRTRLVLAGGPLLEERFASPKLDSFNQRIVARCYLESFNREETQGYIHAQIGKAGRDGEAVVSDEACYAVYQATDGVPRLINQVCDHALLLAYAAGRRQVDRTVIEEAWADLQQLPTPWNGDCDAAASDAGIVEFGGLDDEPEETEGAADPKRASLPMLRISPESEELNADPAEQIEQIEQAISGLEDDFQPAGSIGPEVELVFCDSQDPFNEEFEEEEVIVDRLGAKKAADTEEQAATHSERDSVEHEAVPETVPMHRPERDQTAGEEETVEADEEDMIVVEEGYDDSEPVGAQSPAPVRRQEYGQLFVKLRRSS